MIKSKPLQKLYFFILPTVQLLDLVGPVQAFYEAKELGANYELFYLGLDNSAVSAQEMHISNLTHFSKIKTTSNDIIFLAGIDQSLLNINDLDKFGHEFYQWLNSSYQNGSKICTVCNSTFVLAHSGLLNNLKCTTHWKRTKELQESYPSLKVIDNCLFIKNPQIYTSAGSSAGIDLSLSMIEDDYGPIFTSNVAKELVLYMRRTGYEKQLSFYLDYRNHTNLIVHEVQDFIIRHPADKLKINDLADRVNVSSRHLTRLFKQVTGITVNEFITRLRLEIAHELIKTKNYSLQEVSEKCGYDDPRHFRRLLNQRFHEKITSTD